MPPTTLGHYRLEAQIGEGGMGSVFRAFDTRLNRQVAIKVMRKEEGRSLPVERFLREARAASALNHPNIVIIHEVGETPAGEYFIVQEFVEGQTLRQVMAAPIPLPTVITIAAQIARALAAAHASGIVHRDVKPENIMLRRDGYLKVLDFGLARLVDGAGSTDATRTNYDTAPGMVVGTTSYMSPEQAVGRVVGPASDIFAMGVVLYEMTTGRRPFVASTPMGVIAGILSEHPISISRLNPELPLPLDDLVVRMLDKGADRRPSAREVEEALESLATESDQRAAGVPARTTVGRDAERIQLRRAYQRVKDGRGGIVAVTGEPGIGKTCLVEDFVAELTSGGARPTIARGRCSESLAGSEAYLPILEALDSLLHQTPGPSLHSVFKSVAPNWYGQVATYHTESSAGGPPREAPPAVSPDRLKRELGAVVHEAARRQPLVLVIEDLHWADLSTIDMLNYLAGRFESLRLLVLTTYRPSDMQLAEHPFLAVRGELLQRGVLDEVSLTFLEPADVERYLALQFPAHKFPGSLASVIHAKTEGSPLFMADLLRYLRDTGGIVQENDTWVLTRALGDTPADLPESVRGMIARKIDRLDDVDRQLLVAASVQGAQFDSVVIAQALETDQSSVEDRLEALERVHAFVKRGSEFEFPDLTLTLKYQFAHVLYQNVLHASLSPGKRIALNGKVARALVAHYGDRASTVAARLAVLFEGAREFGVSAQHYYTAAQQSMGLMGFHEAVSLADRGLAVLRGVPDGPVRKQQELGLQMVKGLALRSSKGWATPDLETAFARAGQLCKELDDPPELIPVHWALSLFHLIRGNLARSRESADALLGQAQASGNPAFLMAGYHIAGVAREFMGEIPQASQLLERCREVHDPGQHRTYLGMYGFDPGMLGRAMSSRSLWMLGFADRAIERARETVAIARTQRQPVTLTFALLVMQGIHLVRGESNEALAMGEEIVALCREYGQPQELEWSRAFQGGALALLGRTTEAIDLLSDSLRMQQALDSGLVRPAFLALLAEALAHAGRYEEGLSFVGEGFEHAERTFEGGPVAELHRVKGVLLSAQGHLESAEASFRAALDYAGRQQTRAFELRAATALARLMAAAGRRDSARQVLVPAHEWFTEGHTTSDLMAARVVLAELEAA